jgi:peptidoglycan/LPS O-acetylase OafA/YrhL
MLLATGLFYTPWSWLPRIVMQFIAGALVCAAVRKLHLTARTRRAAGYAALLLAGAIVGILYLLDAHPIRTIYDSSGLVDVLFVPLVLCLAIGAGALPALLSVRPMVYLGHVSFSLYMVHELVHTTWTWTAEQFGVELTPDLAGKGILLGLLAAAVLGAVLLYHFVEEPARKWMRRMVGDSRTPYVNVQPIHSSREERAQVVSARAG